MLMQALTVNTQGYIQRVNQIPMLTAEEEHALAVQYYVHQDLKAAQQLILSHLRLVVKIARHYLGYGLALADLIQEGNIGLMKAVKRFNPNKGVRLVSFAIYWIKAEIHEFVLRNYRMVKIATTKAQRKLFFNLRSAKKRLGWTNRLESEAIAKDLNLKASDVVDMESRLHGHDVSFDHQTTDQEEGDALAPADYLTDASSDPVYLLEKSDREKEQLKLSKSFEQLDPRSRDILEKRWFADEKATLQDLANTYHVSAERVRQLEAQAMKKLRAIMER